MTKSLMLYQRVDIFLGQIP